MIFSFSELFSDYIQLITLLTPPVVLSAFLSGTKSYNEEQKRKTALRTGSAVFVLGSCLYFFGNSIFTIFGFTLDAFRIGAGALLFLTAVSLMNENDATTHPDFNSADISVVPLAIPMCMGPASIGTLMVLGASRTELVSRLTGAGAILLAAITITVILLLAKHVQRILGRTGIAVLSKLTGLLLAAIAAQVVFTGIKNILNL